ncbi:hypothetical protein NL676_027591 [Syzygium grande]|nr:hypothetical protein NL676_027591 [Syzygium grande]
MGVFASLAPFLVALHLVLATVRAGGLLETVPMEEYELSFQYYQQSCPQFEAIVGRKVNEWIAKDYTLAPALMRLHFHDCIVRGCDASVLLNFPGSERSAEASKTLRGFHVIDDIKAELEKSCPKTASCADILTAAARDATVSAGGPFWMVTYGRKDGRVSIAKEADRVPMGHENVTYLLELFQSQGLTVLDLVVLSGAHTIGRSTCGSIQSRLYNYKYTGKPDPTLNPQYANYLQRRCRWSSEYVALDGTTPRTFDNVYYENLQRKMGLLSTPPRPPRDSPNLGARGGAPNLDLFNYQFSVSMANLGNSQVLTGDEGEVRTNCNAVNRRY